MIGMPEQTPNGIHVRVLLNPAIKIGQRVQLDNATINKLRVGIDVQSQANNEVLAQVREDERGRAVLRDGSRSLRRHARRGLVQRSHLPSGRCDSRTEHRLAGRDRA
jgi:hypothetical protein